VTVGLALFGSIVALQSQQDQLSTNQGTSIQTQQTWSKRIEAKGRGMLVRSIVMLKQYFADVKRYLREVARESQRGLRQASNLIERLINATAHKVNNTNITGK